METGTIGLNQTVGCGAGSSVVTTSGGNSTIHYQAGTDPFGLEARQVKVTRPRKITIEPQDYGYLVTVGCQTLCISKRDKLLSALVDYLEDPTGTEQLFAEGKLFKR